MKPIETKLIVLIALLFTDSSALSQNTDDQRIQALGRQAGEMLEKQVQMDELTNDPLKYETHIMDLCILLNGYALDKQTIKAEATYKKIVALIDNDSAPDGRSKANLMDQLAKACSNWGKYDRAEAAYRKGLAMVQSYEGDRKDKALQSMFLTGLGETCLEEGKLDEALSYLQSAYDDNHSFVTQARLAETNRRKKNYPEAERLFKEVLARSPQYPYALQNYAQLLRDTGRTNEAKTFNDRANAESNSPTSRFFKQVLLKMGESMTSEPGYKRLQDENKRLVSSPWWNEYQLAQAATLRDDYKQVAQHCQQCLILMDKSGDLNSFNRNPAIEWMYDVARRARKKLQYQAAIDMYTELMNYGPVQRRGIEASLPTLASICLNNKQYAKAESYWRESSKLKGFTNTDKYDMSRIALCLECGNKPGEAEKIYKEFLAQAIAMEAHDSYCGYFDSTSVGLLNYCIFLRKHHRDKEAQVVLKHEYRLLIGKNLLQGAQLVKSKNSTLQREANYFEQDAKYLNSVGAFVESARGTEIAKLVRSLVVSSSTAG